MNKIVQATTRVFKSIAPGVAKSQTVDGVLESFNKTLTALNTVHEQQLVTAEKFSADKAAAAAAYAEATAKATAGLEAAEIEAARASNAIRRFNHLVAGI
jgi:primosomal protein N''